MTRKQGKVTKAGAVVLEESQLEGVQGGVIAIAPSTTIVAKYADGSVLKGADGSIKFRG